jgi:hypothetical protein
MRDAKKEREKIDRENETDTTKQNRKQQNEMRGENERGNEMEGRRE